MTPAPPDTPAAGTAPAITHVAISASAGSGKTFQLADRFLRLLVHGVGPDRICAMTFSRKAAGEIFESIVDHLVDASEHDARAASVSRRLGVPSPGASGYLTLLRRFLESLHRLHIGTLDSFLIGVIRAFPAELGVAPDFQVMDSDGAAAGELRLHVLQRLFNPGRVDPGARREFLEAYKEATFGREEKSATDLLLRFITDYRNTYLNLPLEAAWGSIDAVWPRGSAWLTRPVDLAATVGTLEQRLATSGWDPRVVQRWQTFIAAVRDFGPRSQWPEEAKYLFEKLTDALADLHAGAATLKFDRKTVELDRAWCALALDLVAHLVATECRSALTATRGLFRVLAEFDRLYSQWSQRTGQLSFTDAQVLLTGSNDRREGALLSRTRGVPDRLYIDYRLDARLDHWMLDEFQDTSDLQWAALRNLVDEIVQDASGQRSFFYVGDVKQAIYRWRGGNARLFGNVLRDYAPRIRRQTLSTSFRSCPPVLACVNAVFGGLDDELLPPDVCRRWRDIWETHASAAAVESQAGYACLLEPVLPDGGKAGDADRFRLAAAVIRELDPLRRGLTVAMLVRSNEKGRELVDVLRRECPDLPVVHEGNAPLTDSPVVTLLMALVRFAAHPGDTLAWRHLQMSPLAPDLEALGARGRLPEPLLRHIHDVGFQPFLREWGAKLASRVTLDAFGRRRLQDLLRAAGEFDALGTRECGACLRFLEHYAITETAADSAVRVMTVHQSKGLGFDVVLVPDLQGRQMRTAGALDLVTARDPATDQPAWVLKLPRRRVSACDDDLRALVQREDDDGCFDELCVLYVALTRARRGLYVITSYPGDTSTSCTPATVVKQGLTGDPNPDGGAPLTIGGIPAKRLYDAGDADWARTVSPPLKTELPATDIPAALPATPTAPAPAAATAPPASRLVAVEPSAHEEFSLRAARLFDRDNRAALDFGSAVHALFEQVGWAEEADSEAILAAWEGAPGLSADQCADIAGQFRGCMRDESVRALLGRPAGPADLWRELRFQIVLAGSEWVRGAFDRVVIHLDGAGRPTEAQIIDYKSDRVSGEAGFAATAEGYRSQLTVYARAVAHMLSLPLVRIRLTLVFTRHQRVWTLTPE